MRNEQRDNEFDCAEVFKLKVVTDTHCHFNNGMYAVDIEEERNQEHECFFVFREFFEDFAQPFESCFNGVCRAREVMDLFVGFIQRNGEDKPPRRRKQTANRERRA